MEKKKKKAASKGDASKAVGRSKRAKSDVVSAIVNVDRTNAIGRSGLLDAAFSSMVEANNAAIAAQAKNPEDGAKLAHLVVRSAEQALAEFICLPMPALAPRYLFQSEGLPLTRFFLISGAEESCKSAFVFEMGRWHRLAGGNLVVVECEVKDSNDLCDSIFGYDRDGWKSARAHTQEEWNQVFFQTVNMVKRVMDGYKSPAPPGSKKKEIDVPGIGRIAPIMLAVDSISAVLLERFVEQMQAEGNPSLTHPLQARLLSDFFKWGPKELTGFPITFAAVSHVKMSSDPRMPYKQIRNTTGGKAPKFQMTCEVDMERRCKGKGKPQYTRTHPKYGEIHSIELGMTTLKNSFGSHASIGVEMTWYFDPDDRDSFNHPKQKTYFDWHTASIDLLLQCSKGGYTRSKNEEPGDTDRAPTVAFSAKRAKRVVEVVELHEVSPGRCWSPVLGVSQASPVSFLEAGGMLEDKIRADASFRQAIYEVMGISRRYLFQPGVDFRQQVANHLAIQQVESQRYRLPSASPTPEFANPDVADGASAVPEAISPVVPSPVSAPAPAPVFGGGGAISTESLFSIPGSNAAAASFAPRDAPVTGSQE